MHLQKETLNADRTQELDSSITLDGLYHQLSLLPPQAVETFVPRDAAEQKELFLAGSIRNPLHDYDQFGEINPEQDSKTVHDLAESLSQFAESDPVKHLAYEQYAQRNALTHEFIAAARDTRSSDEETAANARKRFMELNIELYGAPDKNTYEALINETKQDINQKSLSPAASQVRDELLSLLPSTETHIKRSTPSSETVMKMKDIAEYLYGGMLSHVPADKEMFTPQEIADVFRAIIRDEFEQAADGWEVKVLSATSIGVSATERQVRIPSDRAAVSNLALRGLVVHELGVHMLRDVAGDDTDIPLLGTGMSDYYDAEEGLGKVMEQAIKGEYKDSGIAYYQIAGLMYFDNMDFRDVHEIMWRIELLKELDDDTGPSDADIVKAKEKTYKLIMRITRGTDNLPWFKDLAYYNGSAKMWKYCETASNDPEQFMFLLMGKADVTNAMHRRVLLETHTP